MPQGWLRPLRLGIAIIQSVVNDNMDKVQQAIYKKSGPRKGQTLTADNSLSSFKLQEISRSEERIEIDYSSLDNRGWIRASIQKQGDKLQIEAYSFLSKENPHREEIILLREHIPKIGHQRGFSPALPERIGRRLRSSQLLEKVKRLDRDVAQYRREQHEENPGELRFLPEEEF